MKYRTIVADPPWRYRSSDILTRGFHRTASVETFKPGEAEERLKLTDLERFTSFDSDIDKLVQEARVKLELAEEWAAIKGAELAGGKAA